MFCENLQRTRRTPRHPKGRGWGGVTFHLFAIATTLLKTLSYEILKAFSMAMPNCILC